MSQKGDSSIGLSGRFFRSPWLAMGLIVLAVSAAYSNSLSGPFILDDCHSIAENPTIRSLWPISKVLHPPGEGKTVQGRPVVNLSLAINYALSGEAVLGYHLFNLAVHTLAALALFGIVRRTLLLPGRPQRLADQSTGLALAIALLWGVHPLTTGAVTYIIQRAESLVALFYLLTLYCVIRRATGSFGRVWEAAAVTTCLVGMGCKEVMVSAPVIVLLYDRVFLSRSLKECFQKRGLLYAGLAATWVLLAWLVIKAAARGGTAGFGGEVAWWAYALTQCQAIVTYLKLCFWPQPLVFDYGNVIVTDPIDVWPQGLLLAVLWGGVLAAFRRHSWIGFLGVSFFAILAPSSSVVPVITDTTVERRMYLPLATVIALTVFCLYCASERIWAGRAWGRQRWRWAPAFAVAAAVVVLGDLTYHRNKDYVSELAIWNDTVNKRPGSARAYNIRGVVYLGQGQVQQALADFTQAIALAPHRPEAYNNRGHSYLRLGRFEQALADLTRAITLKPDYFEAHNNRGNTYRALGQFQQALADFTWAVTLRPDSYRAYNNRGNTYRALGQFQQALQDFTQAIALKPDYAESYFNRGGLYYSLGQFEEAIQDFAQLIALSPDDSRAYYHRGNGYQNLAQFDRAVQDYNQAIQLNPDFGPAYANRAAALCTLKQYDLAWTDVARAKELGVVPPAELLRALSEASGRSGN